MLVRPGFEPTASQQTGAYPIELTGRRLAQIVFDFSWDDCNTQEKFERMVMQISGGGLLENGEVKHLQGVLIL